MLEIVLPFALPPRELAPDLIRNLQTPNLARLLAVSNRAPDQLFDPMAAQLPHELWLTGHHAPCHAVAQMQALGLPAQEGFWFILNPVHFHIARDHLVLTDTRQLALTDESARTLFQLALLEIEAAGLSACYGNAQTWFLRADHWAELQTCSVDAACGHNIDIWMPRGDMARAWRKLQNEIQMAWFEHPMHQQRQEQSLPVVNSLWISQGSTLTTTATTAPPPTRTAHLQRIGSQQPPHQHADERDQADANTNNTIWYADTLIGPALNADWSVWLAEMARIDQYWLSHAIRHGTFKLVLTHSHIQREFTCSRLRLAQFWRKSGLKHLL
jgi:hypothetical protein